jgi:phosphoenolpyruvate synthase/pyruvate phosphate dikinase
VQGSVNPDEWLVFKPLIDGGITPDKAVVPEEQGRVFTPIIRRHLGEKAIKMIYNKDPVCTSQ